MSVIYKISCIDSSVKEVYIGSTKTFNSRARGHYSRCYNFNDRHHSAHVYTFIRENGGWKNWNINIIDSLTTTDKNEIEKCERRYIEEQEFSLNFQIPTRTTKEYYIENRETILTKQNQKVKCRWCGSLISKTHLVRHQKTMKCMRGNGA